ncbi:MAG: 4-hydroxy-tetrahydrodipicolinate synthase [Cytophagaceae bacterium]|nr:4-hydroxy-tetrahydrodipicolinate synthase [Cytophagaceae bacterium]|tara:strand:- start:61 stop:936 length:876 start_codon:yes stop_codon:yes gene_type:complete
MQQLKGTGVALVTPFNQDKSVDIDGLRKVVQYSIDGGVEYLVVMGTTAENATLENKEKQLVVKTVVEMAKGKLPLVMGIGGNDTAKVVKELESTDLSAFDAVLSVSPYYNRPAQAGIFEHYKAVAQASPVPVIIYNVPARTGSNILPGTTVKIAHEIENIIGIKEAAGDMVQMLRLLKDCPKDFMVISGDDMLALPTVLAGGDGVISVIGQGLPVEFSQMIRDGIVGNLAAANKKHYALMTAIDLIFAEGNPAGIKALLHQKGLCGPTVRLPLVEASAALKEQLATYLKDM